MENSGQNQVGDNPVGSILQVTNWDSITLKVTGIPPQTRTSDLYRHFAGHGTITSIKIGELAPRNTAWVSFTPIPPGRFWTPNDRMRVGNKGTFRIWVENLPPKPQFTTNPRTQATIPARVVLFPLILQFGVQVGNNSMMAMKTLSDRGNGSLELNFDFRRKKMDLEFAYILENPRRGDTPNPVPNNGPLDKERRFKAEISFSSVKTLHAIQHTDGSRFLIIALESPPLYFKAIAAAESHMDGLTWGQHDTWHRITDLMYDNNWVKGAKTALVKVDQDIDIGRWTVYQLTLPHSANASWEWLCPTLRDYHIKVINTTTAEFHKRPATKTGLWDLLDQHATRAAVAVLPGSLKDYHLPFDVRYQLEACISQGVLSEHNMTEEFVERLAQLARRKIYLTNPAANLLTYICNTGKIVENPMSIFYDRQAMTYRPVFSLPDACEWVRKVVVTPTTMYLSSPTPETTNRVLRQYHKYADRFLRVQFTEEKSLPPKLFGDPNKTSIFNRIHRTLKNGIQVAGRHYEFLAYGNSQLRELGAFFFHPTSDLTCDDIRSWMGEFHHIRVVGKYASRMGQCFSTTRIVQDLPVGSVVKDIPDIEHNGWCFTDGVGKISFDLAKSIAKELKMFNKGQMPSAFQFRLGGSKGLLVAWPEEHSNMATSLKFNQIHLRPSQKKFHTSYSRGIEIIKQAEFTVATLNRQTITLLSALGVPDKVFMEMTREQNNKYLTAMHDQNVALNLLGKHADPNHTNEMLADMVRCGFMRVREPFLMTLLHIWRAWAQKQLKEKARLVVEQGAFLYGCVDETNALRGHYEQPTEKASGLPQIFVQVPKSPESDEFVVKTGICVVGRNPSLHPGDIRVVEAVDIPELRHLRDLVVFPANGDRDIPSMCSGGDLDGDDFYVFWDPRLCPREKNFPPMNHDASKPQDLDRDVQISDIQDFFVEYAKNDTIGSIAHAFIGQADKHGAKDPKCIQLAHLHSKAVDYPKSGQPARLTNHLRPTEYPHFMEKNARTYKSQKVLGQMYDFVQRIRFEARFNDHFDERIILMYKPDDNLLLKARAMKLQYDAALQTILLQYGLETEFELFTTFVLNTFKFRTTDYKIPEIIGNVRNELHERFIQAAVKEAGTKGRQGESFLRLVAAFYRVTWEHVQRNKLRNEDRPFISFPWIFHKELCSIATESSKSTHLRELSRRPPSSKVWTQDITAVLKALSTEKGDPAQTSG
ncbi:hypothetical protein DL767_003951 [Monosporascus sp. MG133]|nr:hypothetical protein DL767_003951 [Monosporascus sp. MG133]